MVFYNGEDKIPEELYMRLSDSFEKREEEPAVECVAKFININYGHNQELLNNCKRLHDYSYFVACVREGLKNGLAQKEAVVCAVEECISKGVLEDILIKHRAEVMDMFLTTFDKKMYEEALRDEGRDEAAEEIEKLSKNVAELTKDNAELSKDNAELAKDNAKLREEIARLQGGKL